ncbi:YfhO family protein [Limosilactobacillus equigenerosi]|uniref:YfhO family protein n=1 Tax=Limosilactobacillus equigenerosi TaxID=417373 RepID=UPI0021E97072|nr:YfhO family protein [Limosilactobacillus equigenerosi]
MWLAARTLKPGLRLTGLDIGILFILLSSLTAFCLSPLANSMTYLKPEFIWTGYVIGILSLMALLLTDPQVKFFFILVAVADVTFNATLTLNNLSYISQSDFANYTQALQTTSRQQHRLDETWYRVAKTVSRTKDDPMQANINSGDEFSSTLPPQMAKLMTHLGQPAGDGVISYISGTSVTDSLLGMKYLWQPTTKQPWETSVDLPRPDWHHQPRALQTSFKVTRNPWTLPLGFGAQDNLLTQPVKTGDPIRYQEQLYQRLAGTNQSFFNVANFNQVNFKNLPPTTQITGSMLVKQNPHQAATMTLIVQPRRGQSSYLTLGNQILEHAEIRVNGRRYDLPNSSLGTIVLNVAGPNETKPVKIIVRLKNESLWLQNMSLYQLDQLKFRHAAQKLQRAPWRLTHATSNYLTGSVKLASHQTMLMTTIPATPGWHAFVDGHPRPLIKVANAFWALKLSPQQRHQVTMIFIPPFLGLGMLITLISLWLGRRYLKP